MQRHTTLTSLAALTLIAAAGCAPVEGDESASTSSAQQPLVSATCPETVTSDGRDPRNAAGQIRYCWPSEARCFCDRDNDCYALERYVACTPRTATSTTTSTTTTTGVSKARPNAKNMPSTKLK